MKKGVKNSLSREFIQNFECHNQNLYPKTYILPLSSQATHIRVLSLVRWHGVVNRTSDLKGGTMSITVHPSFDILELENQKPLKTFPSNWEVELYLWIKLLPLVPITTAAGFNFSASLHITFPASPCTILATVLTWAKNKTKQKPQIQTSKSPKSHLIPQLMKAKISNGP